MDEKAQPAGVGTSSTSGSEIKAVKRKLDGSDSEADNDDANAMVDQQDPDKELPSGEADTEDVEEQPMELDADHQGSSTSTSAILDDYLELDFLPLDLQNPNSTMDATTEEPEAPIRNAKDIAMQNEMIMSTIAKKLPPSDLFQLRRTCPLWKQTFRPQLVSQNDLIYLDVGPERGGRRPPGWSISEFSTAMQACPSAEMPVGGYHIHSFSRYLDQPNLNLFFDQFGKTITRLYLEWDIWGNNEDNTITIENVRKIVFEWTLVLRELTIRAGRDSALPEEEASTSGNQVERFKKEIPKLRNLVLKVEHCNYRPHKYLLEDLFECAVGLDSLSLKSWGTADILQILRGTGERPAESFPALSHLQSLTLKSVKANHLRLLVEMGSLQENPLQLQELVMSVDGEEAVGSEIDAIIELFHRFLVTQSASLRSLDIKLYFYNREDTTFTNAVRLPRMDNLTSLALQLDVQWQFGVEDDGRETFENNFPGLKHLKLYYGQSCEDVKALYGLTGETIEKFSQGSVTSLKLGIRDHSLIDQDDVEYDKTQTPPSLAFFALTWPSVSKMDLHMHHSLWRCLNSFWTTWTGLTSLSAVLTEELYNQDSFNTTVDLDELLSGVTASNFVALRNQLGSSPSEPMDMDRLRTLQAEFKTAPGISDLGHLQEFVLDIKDTRFNITDIGGYMGLAMMCNEAPLIGVQKVALVHKQKRGNRISEECRNFMKGVFGPYAIVDI